MRYSYAAPGVLAAKTSVTFLPTAAIEAGLEDELRADGMNRMFVEAKNMRNISKADMKHNSATPNIEVDPQTYEVRVDGKLITSEPASVLPMAQRYFLF